LCAVKIQNINLLRSETTLRCGSLILKSVNRRAKSFYPFLCGLCDFNVRAAHTHANQLSVRTSTGELDLLAYIRQAHSVSWTNQQAHSVFALT